MHVRARPHKRTPDNIHMACPAGMHAIMNSHACTCIRIHLRNKMYTCIHEINGFTCTCVVLLKPVSIAEGPDRRTRNHRTPCFQKGTTRTWLSLCTCVRVWVSCGQTRHDYVPCSTKGGTGVLLPVYVCVYVPVYVCVYVSVYVCVRVWTGVYLYVCAWTVLNPALLALKRYDQPVIICMCARTCALLFFRAFSNQNNSPVTACISMYVCV